MALSSAETELGAEVKASQDLLGIISLWGDVGETTRGHVMGDASAAIGIIRKRNTALHHDEASLKNPKCLRARRTRQP